MQSTVSLAPEKRTVHSIEASGDSIRGLDLNQDVVWAESMGAKVIFAEGPVDLTGDGSDNVIAVVRPGDGNSDRLVILDENGEKVFDLDEITSIPVTDTVNKEVATVWPGDGRSVLRVASRNLHTDEDDRPMGLKINGDVVATLDPLHSFTSQLFHTWGDPPGPSTNSHQTYKITNLEIFWINSSTPGFVVAVEPRSGKRYSAILVIRLKSHAGDLVEIQGGIYWHPGPLQISATVDKSSEDFTLSLPLIVATGENFVLGDTYANRVAVVVGLNGEQLAENRCWSLTEDDASTNKQEPIDLPIRCLDEMASGRFPWSVLTEPPAQLWYKWIEPAGIEIKNVRIEHSPLPGPPESEGFLTPALRSGLSVIAEIAPGCEFEFDAVYGHYIRRQICSGGIDIKP